MTDYRPVDCGLHSSYELAIMQGQPVRLSWKDNEGNVHSDRALPTDLVTRNGEEFLLATRSNGDRIEIRLDRIRDLEPAR